MANKHMPWDLAQMQSLPLEAKIRMTQERIRTWYESWKRYEIFNKKTGKTRFATLSANPEDLYFIKVPGKKKPKRLLVTSEQIRTNKYEVLDKQPYLKETEYIVSEIGGQVYVSFSGGKDSTVLKHIVDGMYSDVPALFVNTGLEYPEIQKFVKDIKAGKYDCFNPDVEIIRPEMRFDEVIQKYGYPVVSKEVSQSVYEARKNEETGKYIYRLQKLNGEAVDKNGKPSTYNIPQWKFLLDSQFDISHKCCDVMKKSPAKQYEKQTGRKPFIGTMASESRLRKSKWMRLGCNAFEQARPTSQPLSFWTEQDIYHYIQKYEVPYCSVYGDIVIDEKVDGENILEGQVNLIDYLGCYEPEDKLKTSGCDRTGCVYCMFGCHLDGQPNRFQRLKETHPRQYEYCINGGEMVDGKWQPSKEGLGLGKVLDYIGVKY